MALMLLAIVCCLPEAGPGPAAPPGWVEARSKDGAVSFAMPGRPTERAVSQALPQGSIEVLEYSSTSGGNLYRLEKSSLPIVMPEAKLAGALRSARDAVAKKNRIHEDRETTVTGWPARELTIEAPLKVGAAPSRVAMLLFYADNEYYQARVFALEPGREPQNVREFFDSVRPRKARAVAPAGP